MMRCFPRVLKFSYSNSITSLTPMWLSFLGFFEVVLIVCVCVGVCLCCGGGGGRDGGGVKLPHPISKTCQDHAKNLKFGTQVMIHFQFQKIYLAVPQPSNFADISNFFAKFQHFRQKQYLLQSNNVKGGGAITPCLKLVRIMVET